MTTNKPLSILLLSGILILDPPVPAKALPVRFVTTPLPPPPVAAPLYSPPPARARGIGGQVTEFRRSLIADLNHPPAVFVTIVNGVGKKEFKANPLICDLAALNHPDRGAMVTQNCQPDPTLPGEAIIKWVDVLGKPQSVRAAVDAAPGGGLTASLTSTAAGAYAAIADPFVFLHRPDFSTAFSLSYSLQPGDSLKFEAYAAELLDVAGIYYAEKYLCPDGSFCQDYDPPLPFPYSLEITNDTNDILVGSSDLLSTQFRYGYYYDIAYNISLQTADVPAPVAIGSIPVAMSFFRKLKLLSRKLRN